MCDTFVVLPEYTKTGCTIFGKNSDREPNEPQVVEYYPRRAGLNGDVMCTYISIPQVSETYGVLLSRPFWMFGAEIGMNEFGVSMGNEAIFSRLKHSKTPRLLGMDLLRLALERSKDAGQALSIVTALFDRFGQGGTNSYFREYLYDNSFIISDREHAWILETAGDFWVAKEVRDYYSISNILTIHSDYDLCSENVARKAASQPSGKVDFARTFSDRFYTGLGKGSHRAECTRSVLSKFSGKFDLSMAKSLLRNHRPNHKEGHGNTGDICMHSGGILSPDQTASSMITSFEEEEEGLPVAYITGSSLSCSSVFKPHVALGNEFVGYTSARDKYDSTSFWWFVEKMHRTSALTQDSKDTLLRLETDFENEFSALEKTNDDARTMTEFTKACYARELEVRKSIPALEIRTNRYWKRQNDKAAILGSLNSR